MTSRPGVGGLPAATLTNYSGLILIFLNSMSCPVR